MEDSVKRIEKKLDKVEEHMNKQSVSLGRLTVSVEDHVQRTNMLQELVMPIHKKVNMVEGY